MSASKPAEGSVAVVVVNWNNWRLSLACLQSLRTSAGAAWHLFLVDNASTDGSREHLVDLGEDVTVIHAAENGGWTGGNNLGVEAALAAGHDRFFILNNDALVLPDTLAKLMGAVAGQDRPPVLGPIHLDEEDQKPDFIGATISPATGMPVLMKAHEVDVRGLAAFYPTGYIRGAGIFACRMHFDEIGLFDDRYYLNYDEVDWCFRAREKGFGVLMMRDAAIIHGVSGSIGGAESPLNIYFMTRNGLLFAEQHGSAGQRVRQAVALARWATTMVDGRGRWRRLRAVALAREPRAVAVRQGVRDYLARRFGNCPGFVRTLGK